MHLLWFQTDKDVIFYFRIQYKHSQYTQHYINESSSYSGVMVTVAISSPKAVTRIMLGLAGSWSHTSWGEQLTV